MAGDARSDWVRQITGSLMEGDNGTIALAAMLSCLVQGGNWHGAAQVCADMATHPYDPSKVRRSVYMCERSFCVVAFSGHQAGLTIRLL